MLPCGACGARGIHTKCGGLEDLPSPQWFCYNCRSVVNTAANGKKSANAISEENAQKSKHLGWHTGKLWDHLVQSHQDADLDPDLASKLYNLSTQSSTDSTEESTKSTSTDSTTAVPRSGDNRLFEALLATLPQFTDLDDKLSAATTTTTTSSMVSCLKMPLDM